MLEPIISKSICEQLREIKTNFFTCSILLFFKILQRAGYLTSFAQRIVPVLQFGKHTTYKL